MCPREREMLDLVAGHATAQRRDELLEHTRACGVCRAALAELEQLWQALGTLPGPPAAAEETADGIVADARRLARLRWRMNVAAAAMIAAVAGVAAALAMPRPDTRMPFAEVAAGDVAHAIGLDALSGDVTMLHEVFAATNGTEEQS